MKVLHYPDDLARSSELTETPAQGLLWRCVAEHFYRSFIDQHSLCSIGLKIFRESTAGYHFYLVLIDIIPIHKIGVQVGDLQITLVVFYLTIDDRGVRTRNV